MKRRAVASALAGLLLGVPRLAPAQPTAKLWRVGVLESIPAGQNAANLEALRRGLRQLGYAEGRNLRIEYRSTDGRPERFADEAAALVASGVDVIVSRGTPATIAVTRATTSVPVVMAAMGEPRSAPGSASPGSNVTGVTTFSTLLTAKRLEMLKELEPRLARVALMHNMGNPAAAREWEAMQAAARALQVRTELFDVRSEDDVAPAGDRAVQEKIESVVIGADGVLQQLQQALVGALNERKLIASYPAGEFVDAGGLMAYSVNYPDLYFRLAAFVDKILKGAKPGEIPVEGPTTFELAINLKTARALGIVVPRSLLLRADRLIR